jgi:membrane-associated phospholipid phosphatase
VDSGLVRAPRHWIVWSVSLFAATFLLGFVLKAIPLLRLQPLGGFVNSVNSPLLDRAALLLDQLDHPLVAGGILVVVFAVVLFVRGWRSALAVCLIAGFGWITTLVVKAVVAEPRPTAALAHQVLVDPSTLSYPSGHVVFAVSLTGALVMICRRRVSRALVLVVGAAFTLLVAWSRLYVGVHFGADIVGALLNGVAGAILFAGLWNLVAGRIFAGDSRTVSTLS